VTVDVNRDVLGSCLELEECITVPVGAGVVLLGQVPAMVLMRACSPLSRQMSGFRVSYSPAVSCTLNGFPTCGQGFVELMTGHKLFNRVVRISTQIRKIKYIKIRKVGPCIRNVGKPLREQQTPGE